jgi:branched-chain amino acid transport system permease protein
MTVEGQGEVRAALPPLARRRPRLRGAGLAELSSRAFPTVLIGALVLMIVDVAVRSGVSVAGSQLVNGLTKGAIFALIAVGYTMVYGIIELINFAHGDVFTLSAVYGKEIGRGLSWIGMSLWGVSLGSLATRGPLGLAVVLLVLFPLTMAATGITGVLIERVAYRRLRDAPRLAPLITAVGVSFILEGSMLVTQGSSNVRTDREGWIRGTAFTAGGVDVHWADIFVVGMALLMMFALQAFIRSTRLGKAMRATAQDRDAALLSGVNINRTIAATFFIGSALAAAGGLIYSIFFDSVVWNLGFGFGIIAFTAAVLGGIGNIVGAGLGGFLIGLIYVFGGQITSGQWSNSIVFAMLIVVLTFRPVGLLGMRVPDRA